MGQSVQVYRDGELINTREYNAGELFLIFFHSLSRARSLVFARSSALFLSLCLPPRPLPLPRSPSRTLPSQLFASTPLTSPLPALSAGKDWSELEAPGHQSAFDADLAADEARKHVADVTEHAKVGFHESLLCGEICGPSGMLGIDFDSPYTFKLSAQRAKISQTMARSAADEAKVFPHYLAMYISACLLACLPACLLACLSISLSPLQSLLQPLPSRCCSRSACVERGSARERERGRERVLEQYSTETAVPVLTPDMDNPPPPPSFCFDQYYCKAAMKCREYQIAWYGLKKYLFAED
jgi:hypothetical protein